MKAEGFGRSDALLSATSGGNSAPLMAFSGTCQRLEGQKPTAGAEHEPKHIAANIW